MSEQDIPEPERFPVLVVDDEPNIGRVLELILEAEGYPVRLAGSAEAGLKSMADAPAAAMLLDVMLPGIDGLDCLDLVRARYPEVQVVMISGHSGIPEAVRATRAGAADFLPKPLDRDRVLVALHACRRRAALMRRVRDQEAALARRNRELQEALERLQATQVKLVLSEKTAALGRLVAGVAHELNNPVGAALAALDVIARCADKLAPLVPQDDARAARALALLRENGGVAREACRRVDAVVRSLTSFAHLDEAERQRADVHACIDSALELLHPTLGDGVRVDRRFGTLAPIECFPAQLNQVFYAVLRNAGDALGASGGEIRIETEGGAERVRVRITDNGRGIPAEHLDRVFEPGFTTRGRGVGMGMGMALAWEIVQRHGGEISVQSAVGRGTTVSVELPVRAPDEASAAPDPR